jgi:hypothetical protein
MILKETIEDELELGCRKGSATPRKVLRAIRSGVRSAAEFDVRTWWLSRPELDPVLFNVALFDEQQTLLGIADIYDEHAGLVVPVDSVEQHFATPDQVALTERQHRAYRSAGLHVLGIRPSRVRTDPDGLLRDVLDARQVAEALPPAEITWRPDVAARVRSAVDDGALLPLGANPIGVLPLMLRWHQGAGEDLNGEPTTTPAGRPPSGPSASPWTPRSPGRWSA